MKDQLTPSCSVIIVVKDEVFVGQTLTRLKSQCNEIDAECIVIDASEHRIDDIKDAHPWTRWVDFVSPIGANSTISMQRNLGIAEAKSKIIIFCDAGCVPSINWLRSLYEPLKNNEFVAVGGPLIFFHQEKTIQKRNFQERGEEIEYPSCGNLAFNLDRIKRNPIFNEDLKVAEDDDFAEFLRKSDQQIICIPSALIRVDCGNQRRQFRRAWRYGKGIVDLLVEHPSLVSRRLRKNPDIFLYPMLIPLYAALLTFFSIRNTYFYLPFAISTILVLRNGFRRQAIFEHFYHFAYASGSCFRLVGRLLLPFKLPPILQYPRDSFGYVCLLENSLNKKYMQTIGFPEPTSSKTVNLLAAPFLSILFKFFGVKIVNIHWIVGKWQLHWATNKFLREAIWLWFRFWIFTLKISRIRIVYTVHDLISHSKVFNNDSGALEFLINRADALVFLNQLSETKLQSSLKNKPHKIIEEGAIKYDPVSSREQARTALNVPAENLLLVLVGNLQDYKGVDILIEACAKLPRRLSVRIAGRSDEEYKERLEYLLTSMSFQNIDLKVRYDFLSDQEFAHYLLAADYFVYPCRNINNSGSLNAAISAGLPVIVPKMEELSWIPSTCKIEFESTNDVVSKRNLSDLFHQLPMTDEESYQKKQIAAMQWGNLRSWEESAIQYESLYREILID